MIHLTDKEFQEISRYILESYGVDLRKKRLLIEGRLGLYVTSLGFDNYTDYLGFVRYDKSGKALANLINRVTTNHTFFMREKAHFESYARVVLPWVDKELGDSDLRVWSAGCSTGQEPYTLAMCTLDYIGVHSALWDATILASDISEKALISAKKGEYPQRDLSPLPIPWINTYFDHVDFDKYKVKNRLKSSVAFKYFNLMEPFSFRKGFQAIFCRNVMIYFDKETRNDVVNKFYDVLIPGGFLFVGHSESLATMNHKFKYIAPSLYRK
jgi:chemotaxis protein methyltransferase CheR